MPQTPMHFLEKAKSKQQTRSGGWREFFCPHYTIYRLHEFEIPLTIVINASLPISRIEHPFLDPDSLEILEKNHYLSAGESIQKLLEERSNRFP
jgi:hypothetical protein